VVGSTCGRCWISGDRRCELLSLNNQADGGIKKRGLVNKRKAKGREGRTRTRRRGRMEADKLHFINSRVLSHFSWHVKVICECVAACDAVICREMQDPGDGPPLPRQKRAPA
jgi:hypothetical protein